MCLIPIPIGKTHSVCVRPLASWLRIWLSTVFVRANYGFIQVSMSAMLSCPSPAEKELIDAMQYKAFQ